MGESSESVSDDRLYRPRLGAYVLAADPTWIRSSISRYYGYLDVLVVAASASSTGWTGTVIPVDECLEAILSLDTRGIVRVLRGEWRDVGNPMAAETAQRQAALNAVGDGVDWVLQLDTDEVFPDIEAIFPLLQRAEQDGASAVEWPMRVLYRKLRDGRYLEVVGKRGAPRFEYPGPIAVRPGVALVDARRTSGRFVRPIVQGDRESVQVIRPAVDGEIRIEAVPAQLAILHNSWARSPGAVRTKVKSWGHGGTIRGRVYYWLVWLPAPLTWRLLRSFHPFASSLWPRLTLSTSEVALRMVDEDVRR